MAGGGLNTTLDPARIMDMANDTESEPKDNKLERQPTLLTILHSGVRPKIPTDPVNITGPGIAGPSGIGPGCLSWNRESLSERDSFLEENRRLGQMVLDFGGFEEESRQRCLDRLPTRARDMTSLDGCGSLVGDAQHSPQGDLCPSGGDPLASAPHPVFCKNPRMQTNKNTEMIRPIYQQRPYATVTKTSQTNTTCSKTWGGTQII